MRRLSWGTVTALSVAFAAGLAVALALSVRDARDRSALADLAYPEDVAFDLADPEARAAFDEYTHPGYFGGEQSIATDCLRGSTEVYRVEVFAAMDTHRDLALVDVTAGGDRAVVEVRKFVGESERWRSAKQRAVSSHDIGVVRDRAARLLTSRIPVVGERPLDVAEWTVQMCRRGRYHFFQRYGPKRPDDSPFIDFTDAVMALRRGDDPGA